VGGVRNDPDVDLGGKSYTVLESITGSGEWKEVPRVVAVGEFFEIVDKHIKPALTQLVSILEPPPL
jgi:hypothetical protein